MRCLLEVVPGAEVMGFKPCLGRISESFLERKSKNMWISFLQSVGMFIVVGVGLVIASLRVTRTLLNARHPRD